MDIVPNNLEICLKLNRFVFSEAENDIVALTDSRVRILSSHELSTLTTVSFSESKSLSAPPSKPPTQREVPNSNASAASEQNRIPLPSLFPEPEDIVIVDGTLEEVPKRKPSKFLHMINQERKNRWSNPQSTLLVDGTGTSENDTFFRLHKGMHVPPKQEPVSPQPARPDQLVAKQIRDDMFMDILAQHQSQQCVDNVSQVSGMSAKERILKTGHATGIPDSLRQV